MDLGPDGQHWDFCWHCLLTIVACVFVIVWMLWPWLVELGLWGLLLAMRFLWWLHETLG